MINLRKTIVFCSLFLFLIMAGEGMGLQERKAVEPQVHSVRIIIQEGRIICDPPLVETRYQDKVQWVCEQGYPFTVHFGWNSPLDQIYYPAEIKEEKEISLTCQAIVIRNAEIAGHQLIKYFVAVYVKCQNKVLTLDPELVVKR